MRYEFLEILAGLRILALERQVDLLEEETQHVQLALNTTHHQVADAVLQVHSVTYLNTQINSNPNIYHITIQINHSPPSLSLQELLQLLHVLGQLGGGELPVEAKVVEHALLGLPAFRHFGGVPGGVVGPAGGCGGGLRDFYLLALEAVEDAVVGVGVVVGALSVDPPLALVAHDPLLAVVAEVEVDLLAVEAVALLLVLPHACLAKTFNVVLV
jgi:hypothetical protein